MELVKNEEYIVDIVDMGINGEGIAKIDNYPIFIKNAIKGEKVKILLIKKGTNFGIGKVLEIIVSSQDRQNPFCSVYGKCGGCELQHIVYEKQLEYKMNMVKNNFRKFGLDENKIIDIIGMENPYCYRNKAQYPFGISKSMQIVTGFYAQRSHNIIENDVCKIENEKSEKIVKYILEYVKENNISIYDEENNEGYLRHVVIKVGVSTNEIMVVFVTNSGENMLEGIVKKLAKEFEEIKTIVQNVNTKNSNVIMGDNNIILYGNGTIEDKIGQYTFKISALSFYQVNPIQTKKLYDKAKEYIGSANILFDLYCGIGTIGIYCSDIASKVYGIEIVSQAIDNAKENAGINNIQNIEFLVGKAEDKIDELYNKNILADTVLVDPPRKGLDKKLIDTLLEKEPNKIVYISCNNATLARDLKLLEEKYELKECTLVDMFPHTSHVECIAVLELK